MTVEKKAEAVIKRAPLKDIRIYAHAQIPGIGPLGPPILESLPKSFYELGRRISALLYSEGFLLAEYDHLYISFTNALPPHEIRPTNFPPDCWHRYTAFGLPIDIQQESEASKLAFYLKAIFQVLCVLASDQVSFLEAIYLRLQVDGERTRVLRCRKITRKRILEAWFDIPNHGSQAQLYLTIIEQLEERAFDLAPFALDDPYDAYALVTNLSYVDHALKITARKSFNSELTTSKYSLPMSFAFDSFLLRR